MRPNFEIDGNSIYGSPTVAVKFVSDPRTRELEVSLPQSAMYANLETRTVLVITHTRLIHGLLAIHTLIEGDKERVVFRSEPQRVDNRDTIL